MGRLFARYKSKSLDVQPIRVEIGQDGTIFVLDIAQSCIYVLTRDLRHQATWGPELETGIVLHNVAAIAPDRDNGLWIASDQTNTPTDESYRLYHLSAQGDVLSESSEWGLRMYHKKIVDLVHTRDDILCALHYMEIEPLLVTIDGGVTRAESEDRKLYRHASEIWLSRQRATGNVARRLTVAGDRLYISFLGGFVGGSFSDDTLRSNPSQATFRTWDCPMGNQSEVALAAYSPDVVVVADATHHCLFVANYENGTCVRLGDHGRQPGEYDTPTDLAVDDLGTVFVVEAGNRRLQALDPGGPIFGEWRLPKVGTIG